jgi:hypothetical protein
VESPKIRQVALYFSRADGADFEVSVTSLQFTPVRSSNAIGGGSTTNDGIISTRRGNAGSWLSMIGKPPLGSWELSLPNTEEVRSQFDQDQIQDILLVITYAGISPAWPA